MNQPKNTNYMTTILARHSLVIICVCVLFAVPVFSKTPAEYRENISEARMLVLGLLYPERVEKMPAEDRKTLETETVKKIREKIPASEKIEWDGNVITTKNDWLSTRLNIYEDEPPDSEKRTKILKEIEERLSSLEKEVFKLEKASAAARSKDEDKRKLSEILSREEFQKPKEEKSLFQRFWEWLQKVLKSLFPEVKLPKAPVSDSSPLPYILQIILFAAVLGILGFVAYRFAPFLRGRFGRRRKDKKKDRVILGEKLAADTDSTELFSEAERLAHEGNLRGAIRKGYIALLCELSDRKIIGLSQHKTNRDYLQDVRKKRELFENMNGLTSNFERHWYGFDEAETSDWEEFKNGYKKALRNKS